MITDGKNSEVTTLEKASLSLRREASKEDAANEDIRLHNSNSENESLTERPIAGRLGVLREEGQHANPVQPWFGRKEQ